MDLMAKKQQWKKIKRIRLRNSILFTLSILLIFSLSGCGNKGRQLTEYINEIKSRPGKKISPLPEFKPLKPTTYSSGHLRDPFKKSVNLDRSKLAPDQKRPKEPLEAFPLDSLRMVGTLSQGKKLWALIATHDGAVYRVSVGNYLGPNSGRVMDIDHDKVNLSETIQDQEGWTERFITLKLPEQENEQKNH